MSAFLSISSLRETWREIREQFELAEEIKKRPETAPRKIAEAKHGGNIWWGLRRLESALGREAAEEAIEKAILEDGLWPLAKQVIKGKGVITARWDFVDRIYDACFSRRDASGFGAVIPSDWRMDVTGAVKLIERAVDANWSVGVAAVTRAWVADASRRKRSPECAFFDLLSACEKDLVSAANINEGHKKTAVLAVNNLFDPIHFLLHAQSAGDSEQLDTCARLAVVGWDELDFVKLCAEAQDQAVAHAVVCALLRAVPPNKLDMLVVVDDNPFVPGELIEDLLEREWLDVAETLADAGFLPHEKAAKLYAEALNDGAYFSPAAMDFLGSRVARGEYTRRQNGAPIPRGPQSGI